MAMVAVCSLALEGGGWGEGEIAHIPNFASGGRTLPARVILGVRGND